MDTSHIVPIDHISRTSCKDFEDIWPTGVEQTSLVELFMIIRCRENNFLAIATTQTSIAYSESSERIFSLVYMSKCYSVNIFEVGTTGISGSLTVGPDRNITA